MLLNLQNKIKEFFIGLGKVKNHVPGMLNDISKPDSMCLFFAIQSQRELDKLDKLLRTAKFPSKKIIAFVLNRSDRLTDVITNKAIFCFDLNDFSLFGKKNELVSRNYADNNFDLLISFADIGDLINRKLISEINSSFKIGPENPEDKIIFDLIIDYNDPSDFIGYYTRVMHYVSALNITTK